MRSRNIQKLPSLLSAFRSRYHSSVTIPDIQTNLRLLMYDFSIFEMRALAFASILTTYSPSNRPIFSLRNQTRHGRSSNNLLKPISHISKENRIFRPISSVENKTVISALTPGLYNWMNNLKAREFMRTTASVLLRRRCTCIWILSVPDHGRSICYVGDSDWRNQKIIYNSWYPTTSAT